MMTTRDLMDPELMSESVNVIAEGEVQQLMNCNNPDTTEESYMQRFIQRQLAVEAVTQIGAILTESSPEIETGMQNYGKYLETVTSLLMMYGLHR